MGAYAQTQPEPLFDEAGLKEHAEREAMIRSAKPKFDPTAPPRK